MIKPQIERSAADQPPVAEKSARRKTGIGLALLAVGLSTGATIALRLASPVQDVADVNLVAALQQNNRPKYLAALVAVQSDTLQWLDGRRTVITHLAARGDTPGSVADLYSLHPRSILLSNGLDPSAELRVGQKLLIPPVDGLIHRVEERDTLAGLAERFGVAAVAIVRATGPGVQDFVSPGQLLVIPGDAAALLKRATAPEAATPQPTPHLAALSRARRAGSGERYIWPVQGYVGSPFGWRGSRPHEGIDIVGPAGTPVVSARAGMVLFAGWMSGGFGNTVDVRHPDGVISRYAHLSRVLTRSGQTVETGQTLGARGCTGRCTGPHLHFEIHLGGRPVNPLPYLR